LEHAQFLVARCVCMSFDCKHDHRNAVMCVVCNTTLCDTKQRVLSCVIISIRLVRLCLISSKSIYLIATIVNRLIVALCIDYYPLIIVH